MIVNFRCPYADWGKLSADNIISWNHYSFGIGNGKTELFSAPNVLSEGSKSPSP